MSLYEIDREATLGRIDSVTSAGLRALGEVRQRTEEIGKAADEMFARQERARQELDEQVRLAAEKNAAGKDKDDEPAQQKPKPKRTLSLGAEEFVEARVARPAPEPPRAEPARPAPEEPPAEAAPAKPKRTLRLGAPEDRDDEDTPAPPPRRTPADMPQNKPARRRPVESDDDLSGRTWLR